MKPTDGIREAEPADESSLRRLQRTLSRPNPALLSYALDGPPLVLVSGSPPVGYLLAILSDEATIAEVAVAPNHRREGRASALLETAFERARTADCDTITIAVEPENVAARTLYEAHGFSVVRREPDYYSDPDGPAVLMRRPI